MFGRHLAATNPTSRSNASARDSGRDTTLDTDIVIVPDQRQILLDEQEVRSLLNHRIIYSSALLVDEVGVVGEPRVGVRA